LKNKNGLMTFTAYGINFDEFKPGGLYEKRAVATWNFNNCLNEDEDHESLF
jgi:hypothetical protein